MKRWIALVGLVSFVGCEYMHFNWPPENPEQKKLPPELKPKEEPKPAQPDKEPEYKPPDFPYFEDEDEKLPFGPDKSYQPGPRPKYTYHTYPGWYNAYPWYWGGLFVNPTNPAWNLHEHHNHATGTSTFEWMPTGNPFGWGFNPVHHHH
jgi:hypothetical protein